MAQFSKGTFIYLTKEIWKQESNLLNVQSRSKCWSIFCNNIINTLSTFGPLDSGRLPRTSGDQVSAHKFTCQCYGASQRKNQSAASQPLTKQKHW